MEDWIDIKDSLPEHKKRVHVKTEDGRTARGFLSYCKYWPDCYVKREDYWCVFTSLIQSSEVKYWKL
ncbi:hypothetical protein LCGC14_0371030 [marine sediment metagenome]|uniref:Uncharacterized protein n=1 Tax=marine sediment metagenome TaxID=412755 RepID=A0A0F9TNB0_9ZZZZ